MTDPLPPEELRWICDPKVFPFESTAEIEPGPEFLADEAALEALQFGLRTKAEGQNVFVRGLYGAARMVFLSRLVRRLQPLCPLKQDRCYVHNFEQPDRPRLISLRAGQARRLRKDLQGLVDFVQRTLPKALDSGIVHERRRALEARLEEDVNAITAPFEQELTGSGLQLVTIQLGPMTQAAVFPVVDGKPVPPEELNALVQQGKLDAAAKEAFEKRIPEFSARMAEVVAEVEDLRQERVRQIEDLVTRSARELLEKHRRRLLDKHPVEALEHYLDELIQDVLEHLLVADEEEAEDRSHLYELHLLQDNTDDDVCPVVVEHHPSLINLLGTVEQAFGPEGPQPSDYRCIRAGSLLRADGGYLILDADDLIGEPGAWKVLVRTLRTGTMEITPPELPGWAQGHALKPEPIPIQVRVLLVGAAGTYELLDFADKDFPELFKCLVDIDPYVDAEPGVLNQYAGLLARVAADEGMPPFHRDAIAALAEHAARIAARRRKLSTKLSRLADIAREAAFLARDEGHPVVTGDDVRGAVRRTKERAMMPSRIYREEVLEGTILLETRGTCVGQINGLAVMSSGPLTYGFPVRITASVGPGSLGIVDIEERSKMSGSIHT
ncbi:MAG: ATP-binding protein, partial [Planctomycetota bacterium]